MTAPLVRTLEANTIGCLATTNQITLLGRMPYAGTITAVAYVPSASAAAPASGTGRTFTVFNRTTGAGTVSMAARSVTSNVTVADNVPFDVTISATTASLAFTSGDVLEFESLALTSNVIDPGGRVIVTFSRSQSCMFAVDMDDAIPRPVGMISNAKSPALVRETSLPTAQIKYERTGMILHAAQNAMNHSRNSFAAEVLNDLIAEHPTFAKAYAFLGSAYGRMGEPEIAIPMHERAIEISPDDIHLHSTLIFALDQSGDVSLERAYRARRAFNDLVKVDPSTIAPHENDRDPDRKLRIGYVSADFRNHSAAYGWAPVLLGHTRGQFELVAYSGSDVEDERTTTIKSVVTTWHDTSGWDDDRLEQQIREDRIDVLVDLSGHSGGNRLPVFARKPAPVQITGWGYITGTGLDAMDYLFADEDTVKPDEEQWFAEEIVRLPRILTYWAADAKAVGEVVPLPALTNGYLTFGVFNRLGKIQQPCVNAWSEILARLPTARLILKCPGLDDVAAQQKLTEMFELAGCDLGRLEYRGLTDQDAHLKAYHEIDVALDPSPHGGGMSTLEAIWMGVPVLTLPHVQIVSRIATSVAHELGLSYLVADSWPDYIGRAVALDSQRDALAKVRRLMRDIVTVSSFGDHFTYAKHVEAKYRELFGRWCRDEGPKRLRAVA